MATVGPMPLTIRYQTGTVLTIGMGMTRTMENGTQDCIVAVVEVATVKALRSNEVQRITKGRPQSIQNKAVANCSFQQASIIDWNWFGTRGSEVQILSPRPLKSTTYISF